MGYGDPFHDTRINRLTDCFVMCGGAVVVMDGQNDSQDDFAFYAWDLQASMDGVRWFVLDRRIKHVLGVGGHFMHTQRISNSSLAKGEMKEGFALNRVPQKSLASAAAAGSTGTGSGGAVNLNYRLLEVKSPTEEAQMLQQNSSASLDAARLSDVLYTVIDPRSGSYNIEPFPEHALGPLPDPVNGAGGSGGSEMAFEFRCFRIKQHYNNYGLGEWGSNYFKCSGFELHGLLYSKDNTELP